MDNITNYSELIFSLGEKTRLPKLISFRSLINGVADGGRTHNPRIHSAMLRH